MEAGCDRKRPAFRLNLCGAYRARVSPDQPAGSRALRAGPEARQRSAGGGAAGQEAAAARLPLFRRLLPARVVGPDRRRAGRADRLAHHQPHQFLARAVAFRIFGAARPWRNSPACAGSRSGARPARAEKSLTRSPCACRMLSPKPARKNRESRILATDISTRVLAAARRGVYPAERFGELSDSWRRAYLLKGDGDSHGFYKIKPEVARLVEFERLNLIEPFRHGRLFHVIFCRNVMMYFDKTTQQDIVQRLSACLEPGGYLFVGHSESSDRSRARPALRVSGRSSQ